MTFPVFIPLGSLRLHPHLVFESAAYAAAFRFYLWHRKSNGDTLDNSNRWWVIITGVEYHSFRSVMGDVRSLSFRPDSKVLAHSEGFSELTEIMYWDLAERAVLSRWNAHHSRVNALTYSPDGRWLALGGDDGRIRFWQ